MVVATITDFIINSTSYMGFIKAPVINSSLHLQVAIDSATPVDDAGPSGNFMMNNMESFGGYGGPVRSYGRMYGSLDFDDVSVYILMIL